MGAMTAKKFREWSERWNEDFRHYYFVKQNNGYYSSLCQFASKYKGKYEVNFDNVKETLLIVLPKDDYYHKDVNTQKAIRNELERAISKEMPRYWMKDEKWKITLHVRWKSTTKRKRPKSRDEGKDESRESWSEQRR